MTVPTISPADLLDGGYVQEANRQFFHPLGLALAVDRDTGTIEIWDDRDDPEGWFFAEPELNNDDAIAKANLVANELGARSAERIAVCGAVIQGIPTTLREWRTITGLDPTGTETTIRTMWAPGVQAPAGDTGWTLGRCSWELGTDGIWERTVHEWTTTVTEEPTEE